MPAKTANSTLFNRFKTSIENIELPKRFTHMFFYDPHPLCEIAAGEVQAFLEDQAHWAKEFGWDLDKKSGAHGKMLGVLVVKNSSGELGYLTAFSGNINQEDARSFFVPMVYDLPEGENFFSRGMDEIKAIAAEIKQAQASPKMEAAKQDLQRIKVDATADIEVMRKGFHAAKQARDRQRKEGIKTLNETDFTELLRQLGMESQEKRYRLKLAIAEREADIADAQNRYDAFKEYLDKLLEKRAGCSSVLQQKLFDKYHFLNPAGEVKTLNDIFDGDIKPPSGAGDCAAPKLLQYAFAHEMKPLCMAEFWWGASPESTIRIHKKYYPACNNKCKPILAHMLKGMAIDPNPMMLDYGAKKIETVYEDEDIVVVNKPFGLLSVPGKEISDSVATRLQERYSGTADIHLAHRLDMDTSGLILAAKSLAVYKNLQNQFLKRTVEKRYVAVLEGYTRSEEGAINLPLRVDLDNRPGQLVCHEHGKSALTRYSVLERSKGKTRIHFFPVTGRTHQLRVHAAHAEGLSCAILGDVLYGTKGERLYLHAEVLEFNHPVSGKRIRVEVAAEF